jgi:hypothetical protein
MANSQQRFESHESPHNEVEDNITGTNIRTVIAKLILQNMKRSSATSLCVSSLNIIKLRPHWIAKQCHRVHKAQPLLKINGTSLGEIGLAIMF